MGIKQLAYTSGIGTDFGRPSQFNELTRPYNTAVSETGLQAALVRNGNSELRGKLSHMRDVIFYSRVLRAFLQFCYNKNLAQA